MPYMPLGFAQVCHNYARARPISNNEIASGAQRFQSTKDIFDFMSPMTESAEKTGPHPAEQAAGILPSQALAHMLNDTGELRSEQPLDKDQLQPASIDLRLGAKAYRVRASFLPGEQATVAAKLDHFAMHEMDISEGAVLEKGCVYIVPLMESLALSAGVSAAGNPKSSTGRVDVFTRLITDHGTEFDRVRAGYQGPLYAEIAPRTFSILVRKGSRLSQLRIRRGGEVASEITRLADGGMGNGHVVPVSVDVRGDADAGLIGYRAKAHAGLIDIDRKQQCRISDFWEPVYAQGEHGLILDPGEFYILASKESVSIPPDYAAEMVAYDTLVGEFRVHYAGFFDPGFGHGEGQAARAVLEVRSYEVPFVLEHGQTVGRLIYEKLSAYPDKLYGGGALDSSYQRQGLALSKHFIRQA